MDLRGAVVVVAGAGVSGLAAARALVGIGARVTVTDSVPSRLVDLPDGAVAGSEDALPPGTALVVTGPGRRPDHPITRLGVPVVGETELAWWLGAARPEPPAWLVVTGTNGKTTTTGMLEAVLRAAGLDAVACGNIGYPAVDAVLAGHRVLAVELSSFQLHWSPSIVPAAGVVLNVAEDHLDWHGSMDAYAAAKARALLGPVAVAGVDDDRAAALLAAAPAPRKVGVTLREPRAGELGVVDGVLVDRSFGEGASGHGTALLPAADVEPGGPPGVTDALAAAALARAHGVGPEAVRAGLAGFRPGRHRAERVAEVGGVGYVDDSKATNPHAASASLAAVPGRVVWIAGGLLKGASVDDLVARHAGRLRGVVVIGTDRSEILGALARHAPEVPVSEVVAGDDGPMSSAVRRAAALAEPGDVVLLAPAAASMDQFRDYAARGEAFAAAVAALAEVPA
ncbi:UDP-N-acetylmuramoyl-L-alanine--D-glutamate ligase [Pseudonocardia petroleophila]|uniref:UDP-N-acetylmuramoylalanine--D-glutamate ligase n=1 Tax=Pseudonocardia petroleophila TaxID=37331 RepID=A0A7G7MSX5_9PSEU|nr:UDP-N-acetylmuramoyl-L-alanine--D-glutamate ligase [Pseudonocardia petroleophila]QNG55886.1 UDP-N-acetylmuramoyl-L-alanine--D-glutamate ligase [Pseudonocardia petroleophila]